MLNTKKSTVLIKALISIVAICAVLFSCFAIPIKAVAYAAESTYSDVLADLSKDATFSADHYPINQTDYSLKVIQIAESTEKNLILYVYQPCTSKDFKANYISMSLTANDELEPHIYQLTFCNKSGTLYKYIVKDFTVSSDAQRIYQIYSIFRPFDSAIDEEAMLDNTVNSVVYGISKMWKFGTVNGNQFVECAEIKSIDVVNKFVGFVRYANSDEYSYLGIFGSSYSSPIDSHFVAFRTEFPIDELLEADVYYQEQMCSWHEDYFPDGLFEPSSPESKEVTVHCTDESSFTSSGWHNYGHYEWNRIQTVSYFISSVENVEVYGAGVFNVKTYNSIKGNIRNALSDYQWVLRFTETEWEQQKNAQGTYFDRRQIVSNVSILRLKFITAGVTYNLGVIDNMQSGSLDPINEYGWEAELSELGRNIAIILGIVLLLVVLALCGAFLPPIWNFVKFIAKGIFAIIFAPFKLLVYLFGGSSRKRSRSPAHKRR